MKKLFVIMLVVLISVGLFADKKAEKSVFDVNPDRNQTTSNSMSRDLFDLQFQIDVSETVAEGIAGVEYDGEYFYAAEWGYSGTDIHILDIDGTEVGSFTPPVTGSGIRDMAWDGTYLYGSNASSTIYCFDTSGALITTIATPAAVRAIAYDSDLDGFWYNNFDTDLHFVDRSGTLLNTIATPPSMYGCAYDNFSPGGPFLWLFTGTSTGGGCQVEQYDLAAGTLTGVSHEVEAAGISGGLFIADGIVAGKATIGALAQGTFIYGYELCDTAPLVSPGAPTGVTVTPDVGGALTADIDWTCPTLDVGGSTLTDLDEMRVYRDGVLIYTDSAPVIGDPGNYSDVVVPASGNYAYSVVGFNDAGEGLPTGVTSWIGEDVPNVVTDLLLEEQNGNGHLTWVNPTTGLNGGAFNNAILGYHIERNDNEMFEVTGLATEFWDNTIPLADYYCYTITPYNSIGDGGSVTSNLVLFGAGDELFFDDFEAGLGNWNSIVNSGNVEWLIFTPPFGNSYQMPPTSSGNVCSADTDNAGYGSTADCTIEIMTALDLSSYISANIQFDNDWQAIDNADYAYVDVSTDGGTNWTNVLTFDEVDVRETHEIVDITAEAAGQSNVLIRFHSVQPGWDWWWTIDNVGVYATETPADPGSIEGTVVISDGAGDVEDVVVSAGGYSVNPLADGTYSLELQPGTYNVTATLAGYDTEVIEDVEVQEAIATTGIDFTLMTAAGVGNDIIAATKLNSNYPNPFNPITHIAYSIRESGNVTLEVYNLKGQLVKSLLNEVKETGDYTILWNGTDNSNKSVSSGVYFYKMKTQNYNSTKKMILMK